MICLQLKTFSFEVIVRVDMYIAQARKTRLYL